MSILTHMRQCFVKIKLVANKKTENSKTNLEVVDVYADPYATVFRED